VASALAMWHRPCAECQAVDAMEGTIHLAPHRMKMSMKRLAKVCELFVEADDELLYVSLDSLRRDLLASLSAR
jgi:hypothetical protein